MTTQDTIAADKVVIMHYTLKNDAGDVLDSSAGSDPLAYLHGADNIVPGLENALTGKSVGDKLNVEVAPAEGYGTRNAELFSVERTSFPADVDLVKGMQFVAEGANGLIPLWVDRVEGDQVFVDPNHPLAGETLHFDVEIVDIRAASPDEIEHGHPHGPGGHHH